MIIDSRTRSEMADTFWQLFSPGGIDALEITFREPSVINIRVVMKEPLDLRDRVVQVVKTDKTSLKELTPPDLQEILRRVGLKDEEG